MTKKRKDLECHHKGLCVDEQKCLCPAPFSGDDCSECHCSSHGTCDVKAGKCICHQGEYFLFLNRLKLKFQCKNTNQIIKVIVGWIGNTCDLSVCQFKSCFYGGTCVNGRCMCTERYTGEFCEFPFTACDSERFRDFQRISEIYLFLKKFEQYRIKQIQYFPMIWIKDNMVENLCF